MGKDKTVLDLSLAPLVETVEMDSVLGHHVPELRPGSAAYIASRFPGMHNGVASTVLSLSFFLVLIVKVSCDSLDIIEPLIPTLPCCWSALPLMREQINTIVKLSHSLSNLTRHVGISKIRRCKSDRVKVLLETAILESSQQ